MIATVYSLAFDAGLPAGTVRSLLSQLPADIQEKARAYRRWQDVYACIFGRYLLAAALRREGFSNRVSAFRYLAAGKPYFPGGPEFNLTHSGNRVACVIGPCGGIGIDIEELRPIEVVDFERQFSADEWQAIMGSGDAVSTFYHYWTAKESVIKADGRGLGLPLRELTIGAEGVVRVGAVVWHVRQLHHLLAGYAGHIATESPVDEVCLRKVTLAEILSVWRGLL